MPNPHLCPICQLPNHCEASKDAATSSLCWCMQVEISKDALTKIPVDQVNRACICHSCATAVKTQ
ncbi:MAG: DNA or RNA helicase of superfamily II [Gammaproteobacteria bacterium]|nr:MAG: DNA or RNA helicase of superfamily II [Gammaproteobacteria bacterium]